MTRFGYVMTTYFAVFGIGIAAFVLIPVRLIWNASASVPLGLYKLGSPRDLHDGDLVAVMPPKPLADFMVERGYLGRGVPFMKHVAALPGQTVCRLGNAITIDGTLRSMALDRCPIRFRALALATPRAHRAVQAIFQSRVGQIVRNGPLKA